MEAIQMSTDRGMDKEDVIHIYNEILLNHKRDSILPFAEIQMDLETGTEGELSQKEKNKSCIILLMCGIQKNDRDELTCKAEIQSQTQRTHSRVARGTGWVGRLGLACTLLSTEQLTGESLPHGSAGSAGAGGRRKGAHKRGGMCTRVTDSFCWAARS